MHGIMYLRKSREDILREKETGEDVLQTHRERLTALLESQGHQWEERAEIRSGDTIADRPEFQKVLYENIPGGAEFIAVTEISRLGRGDMRDAGEIYNTIIKYNVLIITPHKTYDPQNPADLRQLRFELFLSREEFELIKERLSSTRHEKAMKGYAGNYICTLGFDQSRGNVKINKEEATVVLEIFNLRKERYSGQEIADLLNARGLKTKRGTIYHQTTIHKILKNKRYIGIATWRGNEIPAKHPPIIPIELWNDVQKVNKELTHAIPNKTNSPYLVDLYCHECGNRMYGEMATTRKRLSSGELRIYNKRPVYVCSGRRSKPKCSHTISGELVHEMVLAELCKIATTPRILRDLVKERSERLYADTTYLENELFLLEKEIKAKNDFLARLERDYENGDIEGSLYNKHYNKTSAEINTINLRKIKIESEIATCKIKPESPGKILKRLRSSLDSWEKQSNNSKKEIIRLFLPRIEVDKQGVFYINPVLPIFF